MEEEFYAIIKLVSGEEIMALVSVDDNDNDPILICQNPTSDENRSIIQTRSITSRLSNGLNYVMMICI